MRDQPRVPVEDLTVLLLTHPSGPVLLQALDALARQERRPQRIVVTGLPTDDPEFDDARRHPLIARGGVELVAREPLPATDGPPPLWQVIEDARADLPARPRHWIWILQDDSVPAPDALAELIEATQSSSGVGVVGPKLVRASNPRQLISVGHSLTRGGRVADTQVAQELDQGQHDQRQDVIGVPLTGMLVRSDVLAEIGGVERAFDHGTEGLDVSWRSHLAGHRVVVATSAVVAQAENGHPAPTLTTRRRVRQLALARGSVWAAPFRALGILIVSVLAGLGLLLIKRPAESAAEFSDAGAALSPGRGLGARWRFRGRTRVRRRHLAGLFAPASSAWHSTSDHVYEALASGPAAKAGGPGSRAGAVETGPVAEEAEALESAPSRWASIWSWPLVTAVLVAIVTALFRWRDLLGSLSGRSAGVAGGAVQPIDARWSDLWAAWAGPWTGAGLGSSQPTAPWLLPMSGFTWAVEQLPWVDSSGTTAAVTVTWILFAALPLSVVSAYFALRVGVRSRWVRAVGGLVWAGMAPLTAAVDDGRLGPVIAHVAMPLLVAGVIVAGSRRSGALRTSATFATALLTALVGLFTPAVLVLMTLAGLLVLIAGPGWGRLRGLVLVVLPWLLTGPWLAKVLDDPRLLLSGAGASTTIAVDSEPWQTLLLHPGGGLSPTLWWTLPLVILSVGAALRRGHRGRRATGLLIGALLGLAAALAAPVVTAGEVPAGFTEAGASVTAWPGLFVSVTAACLLLAAAQAIELPPVTGRARWHRPLVSVLTGVVAVAGVATLAWSAFSGVGPHLSPAKLPYPEVVTAQAAGPDGLRILDLSVDSDRITYRLQGREPGLWVRDQVGEIVEASAATDGGEAIAQPGRQAVVETVAMLTSSGGTNDSTAAHQALMDLGVGYVGLRVPAADPEPDTAAGTTAGAGADADLDADAAVGQDDPLVATLDATAALTRVNSTQDLLLWRVGTAGPEDAPVPPSRVWLADAEGMPLVVVPVDGPHSTLRAGTEPPAGTAALVVSEEAGWGDVAVVRASGEVLQPVAGEWPLRYEVSAGAADQIQIELPRPDSTWRLITLGLIVITTFLALPIGSRRRRATR